MAKPAESGTIVSTPHESMWPMSTTSLQNIADKVRRLDRDEPYVVDAALAVVVLAVTSVPFMVPQPGQPPVAASYVVSAATALALIWRRRFAVLTGVAVIALMCVNVMLGGIEQPLPYAALIAVVSIAATAPAWQRTVMHPVAVILAVVASLTAGQPRELGYLLLGYCGAYAFGRLVVARRHARDALHQLHTQSQLVQRAETQQLAAAQRAGVAESMQDVISRLTSLMVVQAEAGPSDPKRAAETFDAIAGTGRRAITQLERIRGVLRDGAASYDKPTLDDIEALVGHVEAAGSEVSLETHGRTGALDPAAESAVYRIVQQSLTNVVKSADARSAAVRLAWSEDDLTVTVSDESQQSRPRPGNGEAGLAGLNEQAAEHGGTVTAGPTPEGHGYQVVAAFPLLQPDPVGA